MNDAQSAIIDIKDALAEYGSDVTLNTITVGAYNPITDTTTSTTVSTPMKALIKHSATAKTAESFRLQNPTSSYDYALMLYSTIEPEINDTVTIGSGVFNIVFVDKLILQNTIIKFEVLVKK
jgi:hypothetical protein